MTRMEEFEQLTRELSEPVPRLEQTLHRAKRKRRNRRLRSVANIAVCFGIFVLLVNFCTPVAYACSKVPLLRELAEAVTFSRSLTDAVDNEYVQPLYLAQEDNGISASVEYLIVDQKQVNVFFRLRSEEYPNLSADPTVLAADGNHPAPCSYGLNDWDVPNGELQSITIDFVDEDVPDSLRLQLDIRDMSLPLEEVRAEQSATDAMLEDPVAEQLTYLAHFDFLLEFDPAFTATGKIYSLNQMVTLEGQEITFTDMEVFPTHLRVNIADSPDNTAWLCMLYFYVETDWGMKFDAVSNGITATGSTDTPTMNSFRADSPYFYDANHLKLVITGAEWLNKDMEKTYVNLVTGETGPLPEGVSLYAVDKKSDGWQLKFEAPERKPGFHHQLFNMKYYDVNDEMQEINSWGSWSGEEYADGTITFREVLPLKDYPYEEVWLCPHFSHVWTAEEPVTIVVQ